MTALDRALVRRKLATITRNLRDLAGLGELSLEAYRQDRMRQKAVERLLQELVEAAVDANQHLLAAGGHGVASDYYQSFIEAGRRAIIPAELAQALAPSAGLRNRLVHEYDEIDDAIVLGALRTAARDYARYVRAVEELLSAGE